MADNFRFDMLIPHDEMLGISDDQFTDAEVERTSYRPTIVIGLGGTGYSVVRKLKRRIEAHFGAERARVFQYLAIDSTPEKPPIGEAALGGAEFMYLKGFPANRLINALEPDDPVYKWWMHGHMPDFTGNGAGQIRAVGRLVLFHYASHMIAPRLREKIRQSVNVATSQGLNPQSTKIYIVSSLAGGTGSGMFIDMAYMARNEVLSHFNGACFVTGVLVMPSAYVPLAASPVERQRMQANGYSALKELDMLNSTKNYNVDYGGGYSVGRLTTGIRPFDISYLLGLFNENNQALSGAESLIEMVAEEMMLEIASPMEGSVNNILDNVHATEYMIDGHPTAYSSFAVSSLVYPLRGVASWCGLKHEDRFILELLLNPIKSLDDARREATEFIDQSQLREEGADQIIDALGKDTSAKDLQIRELEYAAVEGVPRDSMLDAFQGELPACRDSLEAAKKQLDDRLRTLQVEKPPLIRKKLNQLMRDPERGPEFAKRFLGALDAKLRADRSEQMLAEQAQYQTQMSGARSEMEGTSALLEKALHRPAFWPGRKLSGIANDYVGAINDYHRAAYEEARRERAVHLYDTVLQTVGELEHQVKELIADFKKEAENSQRTAEQARVRLKVTQAGFSLVKSAVSEEKLLETYERHKPKHDTDEERRRLLSEFWRFFGEREPKWELGTRSSHPEGIGSQAFYFLGQLIGQKLATVTLLDRMKDELHAGDKRVDEWWKHEIQERYAKAAPFWNTSIIRSVHNIMANLTRSPNVIGYGAPDRETHWSEEFNQILGATVNGVQTKNDQEIVFLKTAHGLPLFAIHEVEAELESAYRLLQADWEAKRSQLPVHAARDWQDKVTERESTLLASHNHSSQRAGTDGDHA